MSEHIVPENLRGRGGPIYTDADVQSHEDPGFVDGLRFLYRRRVRLAVWFIVIAGIGVLAFLVSRFTTPPTVQGVVAISFRGIEKHEYPSGRKFTVEIFRSPEVLTRALSDAGIPENVLSVRRLSAGIVVTPIIPGDVQARWMKHDRDGIRRDEYFPNEFRINLRPSELSSAEQLRLFDALVKNYQGRVKYEQEAAFSFIGAGSDTSHEKLAAAYDFWDIPPLFTDVHKSLDRKLKQIIVETLQYQDAKFQLAFRDIERDLHNWQTIRLNALEASIYQGRLVKNKDLTIQRIQHRLEDVDIKIRQKVQEANEALRLLALIERPNSVVAGRLGGDKGLPLVDAGTLDRLVKNDYVAPVVTKISALQSEIQSFEAEKSRMQRHLAVLAKATNVDVKQLPAGYAEVVRVLSSELEGIVQKYNRVLDEYLSATVSSLVTVKQAPIVARDGYSTGLMLLGILFLSFFLAIFMIGAEHLARLARRTPRSQPTNEGVAGQSRPAPSEERPVEA
jgi:hypothetical protein